MLVRWSLGMLFSAFSVVLASSVRDWSSDRPEVEVISYNDTDEDWMVVPGSSKKLTEHLLARHNLNAPPDGLLDVHYEMELVHILGIDELKQTMTALVYVDERWSDDSLSWDPNLFGGIQKTWLPMEKVWIPDIIIFNMLEHEDLLSAVRAPVLVYANGTVEASHPAVYTVSCEINIKHFPLDDQRCALEIASWAYGKEKIRMHAHTEHSLQHYTDNEEWKLLHVTVKEDEYEHEGIMVSELKYEVSVRRKPLFYMVTLTFPSYVMCAISVVGLFARFSTTGEREERFTLGVTAILTMAVLSLVVSEKVPHSSTSVPLLVAYFLFNMVIVSIAAMTTGIVMRVHRMGRFGDEPHVFWLRIFLLRPIKFVSSHTPISPSHVSLLHNHHVPEKDECVSRQLRRVQEAIKRMMEVCESGQTDIAEDLGDSAELRRRKEANGYVRLAERLDLLFMTCFLTMVTVPVVVLFMLMD